MNIFLCDNNSNKNCIGKGGNKVTKDDEEGNNGENTQVVLSGGNKITALGGHYGERERVSTKQNLSYFSNISNKYYYLPSDNTPEISENGECLNCYGIDKNEPEETSETYESFGEGGGGSTFLCRIDENKEECTSGPGGFLRIMKIF